MYSTPPETRSARKTHRCTYCAEQIEVGAQYQRWMSVDDGNVVTNKMHPECLSHLESGCCGGGFEYDLYSGDRPQMDVCDEN